MTLYLVHGNTWFEGYGYEEHVFGVFTSREKAEEAKIITEKRLQEEKRMIKTFIGNSSSRLLYLLDKNPDLIFELYNIVED